MGRSGRARSSAAVRPAPPVTVTGGPAVREPAEAAPGGSGGGVLLLGVLALGAATLAVVAHEPPPARAAPLQAQLRLVDDALSNSQSGVLVLPVELVNRGPAVVVERTQLYAEPVRQEPASNGETRVEQGGVGRIAVLVQPHCAMLVPRQWMQVAATVVVSLRGPEHQQLDVRLDLGREPAVVQRVASLCRAPGDYSDARSGRRSTPVGGSSSSGRYSR